MTVNTQGDQVEIVIVISNSQMLIADRRGSSVLGFSSVSTPGLATSLLPASAEHHLPFRSKQPPARRIVLVRVPVAKATPGTPVVALATTRSSKELSHLRDQVRHACPAFVELNVAAGFAMFQLSAR